MSYSGVSLIYLGSTGREVKRKESEEKKGEKQRKTWKEMETKEKHSKKTHQKEEKSPEVYLPKQLKKWFLTQELRNSELNFWNLLGSLKFSKCVTRLRHPRQLSNVLFLEVSMLTTRSAISIVSCMIQWTTWKLNACCSFVLFLEACFLV